MPSILLRLVLILVLLSPVIAPAAESAPLAGTGPLSADDYAIRMLEGMDRFLDRHAAESIQERSAFWKRDTTSPQKYEQSIAPNRAHLMAILGVVDAREKFDAPELIATVAKP